MSKFDLRDISDRLARSRDTEAVVFEFLGYLQAVRPDWRATLAFYEVSHDALVNTYERMGSRLVRRDVTVPVSQLPARLVRKFFHPSAFFNHSDRRSLISQLFTGAPYYEPDPAEAAALRSLTPLPNWQSCVCLPLADQEDMLALLVLASENKAAFPSKIVGDVIPVKSMAALALTQHLYRSIRGREAGRDPAVPRATAADFSDRIQLLNTQTSELEEDNKAKARRLEALTREIELLDRNSSQYKTELERVKGTVSALEVQSAAATEQLTDAYSQLTVSQARAAEFQRTVGFMKEVTQVLAQEHRPAEFATTLVAWFSQHFAVERCSLMQLDPAGETLVITAQRGIDPELARHIKVRIGQGVSGWVAHNRRPLLVRVKQDAAGAGRSGRDDYNSDSFICVPLVYNNRMWGVLNLSNKREGALFDDMELDRAQLAASMMAIVLSTHALAGAGAMFAPARPAVSVR
jgi:putative methionine-R-sulfoxide reductase with GAF domain